MPATFPRLSWKTPVSPLLVAALIHSWSAAAPPSGLRTFRLVAHLLVVRQGLHVELSECQ